MTEKMLWVRIELRYGLLCCVVEKEAIVEIATSLRAGERPSIEGAHELVVGGMRQSPP